MLFVALISKNGKPLDPIHPAKARQLLKSGEAVIYKYRPMFAIKLVKRVKLVPTKPLTLCIDPG